jgi:transposase
LNEKIAMLKQQMEKLNTVEAELQKTPDKQISLTDPDARSMATSGRGSGMVGYNVQTAVDTKNHLIVAHEVTNVGHDRSQLANMAKQAQVAMDASDLNVVADRGYFSGEEVLKCHQAGITPFVPKCVTSGAKADGRFDKAAFVYNAEHNEYRCPAGQRLIWRSSRIEHGLNLHRYWSSSCQQCAIKAKCTPSTERRVTRWEHEDILEAMQRRLDMAPDSMRIRRQTVEHPFGTLKAWMGSTHFLTKTLKNVSTEMSLHVLAYNLKRVMKILGTATLMEAMVV